jgi:hypothetical protein
MDSGVHFEMPHENRDRMARFHPSAFGWQTPWRFRAWGNACPGA